MKNTRAIICIILIICTFFLCACSNKKRVPIIDGGNNNTPEQKKTVDEPTLPSDDAHDYSEDIQAVFSDTALTLTVLGSGYKFPYEKIEEFSYMTEFDYSKDTQTDGRNTDYEICGKMKNQDGEKYMLFIYKTTPVYIAVYFGGKQYVFNLDSAAATKEAYNTLKEKTK